MYKLAVVSFLAPVLVILLSPTGEGGDSVTCPGNYTNQDDNCFLLADIEANWVDATIYCNAYYGGVLAITGSSTKKDSLKTYLTSVGATGILSWGGLTDHLTDGDWTWYKDLANYSDYSNWNPPSEPNGADEEQCLSYENVNDDMRWTDIDCVSNNRRFVCEYFP